MGVRWMGEQEQKFRINFRVDRETYVRALALKRALEDMVIRGELQLKPRQGRGLVDWDDVFRYLMDKAERCDAAARA
ncbi:MAG: hypothetical protein RXR82_00565 [Nitrososphaeria archaeon]